MSVGPSPALARCRRACDGVSHDREHRCRRRSPASRTRRHGRTSARSGWWTRNREYSPYRLFSHTNITGSRQIAARLSASWKAPMFTAPSPKKHEADLVALLIASGESDAVGDRKVRTDDRERAEGADAHVGQVHRAALAAAQPVSLPHDLGERHGRAALPCQHRAMSAVGAKHLVAWRSARHAPTATASCP